MNEDLKYLAENVHEWPRHDVTGIGLDSDGEFRAYGVSCELDCYPNPPVAGLSKSIIGRKYTRAEWQAARDELSGKPSWEDAPVWAKWLAQDKDGRWWYYREIPTYGNVAFGNTEMKTHVNSGKVLGDWRNTLERRPAVNNRDSDEAFGKELKVYSKQKQWRGPQDGVPPVDTECEVEWNENVWRKCVILLITDQSIFIRFVDEGTEHIIRRAQRCVFRPIHTEEDKAVEEMMRYSPVDKGSMAGIACQYLTRELYRAGYHRQETK